MKSWRQSLCVLAILFFFTASSWAATPAAEYRFHGTPDGSQPDGGLVSDGAGNFYGTTSGGGLTECGFSSVCGTVFKLSPGKNHQLKETLLYKFRGGTDGAGPAGPLVFDTAGNLYGTTTTGGNPAVCNGEGCGTVFKLSPNQNGAWTESVLYSFLGSTDAEQPASGVIFDSAGNMYGAAGGGCVFECNGTIFKLSPNKEGTWTESIVYTFQGGTDGGFPISLTFDGSGNMFGATFSGGTSESGCGGCGTVFEMTLSSSGQWTKQILYSFTDGLDGGYPSSGVTLDSAGNLYGETFDAGSFACPESGCGVVYRLSLVSGEWKLQVVHTFNGINGSKGSQPDGGLTFDASGNLYGTTSGGGNLTCNNGNGCGSVFKLSPSTGGSFTFTMLATFNGMSGTGPNFGAIFDAGTLYGTTFSGGSSTCVPFGCGVAFAITP